MRFFIVVLFLSMYFIAPQLLILNDVQFSPGSALFSYDVNIWALPFAILILYYFRRYLRFSQPSWRDFSFVTLWASLYILALAFLSMQIGFVDFELKSLEQTPNIFTWFTGNFFVTVPLEETLWRFLLPLSIFLFLEKRPRWNNSLAIGLMISSVFFGLWHFSGGIALVALATLSGLFYSWIFFKYKNLVWPIWAHFLVNFIHLLFFTYPHSL